MIQIKAMLKTRRRSAEVEVNLTPLIDVVFLLLIFFMISTQFKSGAELELELPSTTLNDTNSSSEALRVVISRNGQLALDGQRLEAGLGQLKGMLEGYADVRDRGVVLEADASATHQSVVDVLAVLSVMNVTKVVIATKPGVQDES